MEAKTPILLNTNHYTIRSLDPGTCYKVYIRSVCSDGSGYSIWEGPFWFNTEQTAAELPFIEDFENGLNGWTLTNDLAMNKFCIGSATASSGNNSLYISKDLGATYTYNTHMNTQVYAYRRIHLPKGYYDLNYDWKSNGMSQFDYGRVYLISKAYLFNESVLKSPYTLLNDSINYYISLDSDSYLQRNSEWKHFHDDFMVA